MQLMNNIITKFNRSNIGLSAVLNELDDEEFVELLIVTDRGTQVTRNRLKPNDTSNLQYLLDQAVATKTYYQLVEQLDLNKC